MLIEPIAIDRLERNIIQLMSILKNQSFTHPKRTINLFYARRAKWWFDEGQRTQNPRDYLHSASLVHKILSNLSESNCRRVRCQVEFQPALKRELGKAKKNPELCENANVLYNFIKNDASAWSLSKDDMIHSNCSLKTFGKIQSEKAFYNLLQNNYIEIYCEKLSKFRVAIKISCTYFCTNKKKEQLAEKLKTAIGTENYESYKTGIDILYPDSEYTCSYMIYIPRHRT